MDILMILSLVFVFVLGLCIGSFLNCLVYRMERKRNLLGRSFCPHCKATLQWRDLVPVFSFLSLGGKCRYCQGKISWQYPLAEIATAIVFLLAFLYAPTTCPDIACRIVELAMLFYISGSLIVIFMYDFKHFIIPDKILFPAISVALLYRLALPGRLADYLLAVFSAAGFFFIIFYISKGRWMGFGDVKLAVLMGLLLGIPGIFTALFTAFLMGALFGVALIFMGSRGLKSEMPFAPFLVAGTFLALFWGTQIVNWYLNLIRV